MGDGIMLDADGNIPDPAPPGWRPPTTPEEIAAYEAFRDGPDDDRPLQEPIRASRGGRQSGRPETRHRWPR